MKNERELRVTKIFKAVFNVRGWVDYDRMKAYTLYLLGGAKRLVIPDREKKKAKQKSFSESVKVLKLSEKDLAARSKALYRLSILMCLIAIGLFAYTIYQLIVGTFYAAILSLIVGLIGLVLAFRYHFWYFQIKEKKLGCTFKEWYRNGFLGEKR